MDRKSYAFLNHERGKVNVRFHKEGDGNAIFTIGSLKDQVEFQNPTFVFVDAPLQQHVVWKPRDHHEMRIEIHRSHPNHIKITTRVYDKTTNTRAADFF